MGLLTAILAGWTGCRPPGAPPAGDPSARDAPARPEQHAREVTVSPPSGPAGAGVHLMASGLPASSPVQIGFGPVDSEFEIIGVGRTDDQGTLHLTVTVPDRAAAGHEYVFVVTQEGIPWKEISDVFVVTDSEEDGSQTVRVRGRLTDEGVECPALRAEDGTLYTLAGDLQGFQTGDSVYVEGTVAEISFCMQGTTISVERIEPLNE